MRIWDIDPGYLNRQSLLGEHRELHGIVSILVNGKKGYSRHPETIRWVGHGWALMMRHQLLAAEMKFRQYTDRSPVCMYTQEDCWPKVYIDEPYLQFRILAEKYKDKEQGRILLPANAQQLWSQHKYSVLAREVNLYKKIGRQVAAMSPTDDFSAIANVLAATLRTRPSPGGIRNALQHMWGYVSDGSVSKLGFERWSLQTLLHETQLRVREKNEPYLMASTALCELEVWIAPPEQGNNGSSNCRAIS